MVICMVWWPISSAHWCEGPLQPSTQPAGERVAGGSTAGGNPMTEVRLTACVEPVLVALQWFTIHINKNSPRTL